jgi:hypothetical protein
LPTTCWRSRSVMWRPTASILATNNLSSYTRKAVLEQSGEKVGHWLWNRFTCTTPLGTALAKSGGNREQLLCGTARAVLVFGQSLPSSTIPALQS